MKVIAWLISYTYIFHLLFFEVTTCTQGSDAAFMNSLVLGTATIAVSAVLFGFSRRSLLKARFMGLFHLLTVAAYFFTIPKYLLGSTFGNHHLCGIHGDAEMDSYLMNFPHWTFALVHTILVTAVVVFVLSLWLKPKFYSRSE